MVKPLGLDNAPSTFLSMINSVFRDILDAGVIAYRDDILIYAETMEEFVSLRRQVIETLRKANLCFRIKTSILHQGEVVTNGD